MTYTIFHFQQYDGLDNLKSCTLSNTWNKVNSVNARLSLQEIKGNCRSPKTKNEPNMKRNSSWNGDNKDVGCREKF